jgi:DNA-binding NarL/FixJ family response regulator
MLEMSKKVLVVDDHPIFRAGISHILSLQPGWSVCCEAGTGKDALQRIAAHRHDLMVTDMSLPGVSGIDLTKMALKREPELIVLVVSVLDDLFRIQRALKEGARGYITKGDLADCLITAVNVVFNEKKVYVSPEIEQKLVARFAGQEVIPADPVAHLSERETEVFIHLGKGLTKGEIAVALNRSPSTVETYRSSIKRKLNLATGRELNKLAARWVEEHEA